MRFRLPAVWLGLIGAFLTAGASRAAVPIDPIDPICADPLPFVLNLGLPRMPNADGSEADRKKSEERLRELKTAISTLLDGFYREHGRCAGKRHLQVNITVASDYEILDWLSQDLIQAAVVSDMTLFLLTERDGLDLRKLEVRDRKVGSLLLPALTGRPMSGQAVSSGTSGWRARSNPGADLEDFSNEIWEESSKPAQPAGTKPEHQPRHRLVLASHLSTPGFLDPILAIAAWLEPRLAALPGGPADPANPAERRERFWEELFKHTRFAIDCNSLEPPAPGAERSCWQGPAGEAMPGPIEILFPGESALRGEPATSAVAKPAGGTGYREHLVLAGDAADQIFFPGTHLREAVPTERAKLRTLFCDRVQKGTPLRAFATFLDPEPLFGVRTFGFTVDEAMRLLRQDQRTTRPALALVLPGGGVKAAYQSRIVDALYGREYLQNVQAPAVSAASLKVSYVVGTSGGALLGYFVSQLDPRKPTNLTRLLWQRERTSAAETEDDLYLKSSDVFDVTDLLRYASVVVCFLVLCTLLGFASIPERGPLNPTLHGETETLYLHRRLRLRFVLLPLLLAAPVLVRLSNGPAAAFEQIPKFEGFIYAVLTMLIMFADQCLVLEKTVREKGALWVPPWLPLAIGGSLVALPFVAIAAGGSMSEPLTFLPAYTVLAPLVLFCGLILPLRIRSATTGKGLRGAAGLALEMGLPLVLALLGSGLAGRWLDHFPLPFYLVGFLVLLIVLLANVLLRPSRTRIRGRGWWAVYGLSLLVTSILVMRLCWPETPDDTAGTSGTRLSAHTLEISVGTFLLCVGLLILLVGGLAWVYSSGRRYHLRRTGAFFTAFVVVLLHVVLVSLIQLTVTVGWPDLLSPLELTSEFWIWLLGASLIVGLLVVLPAAFGRKSSRFVKPLRGGLLFLCSHHPNGDFVTRRFFRMAALSVFSLLWWNAILAPALYGNGQARDYLKKAVARFQKESGLPSYQPSAGFITPANLLEPDGTRYFLFAPSAESMPVLARRPTGGGLWCAYTTGETPARVRPGCPDVPSAERRGDFLERVIFASGSPFPIFPAHQLTMGGKDVGLVDGGYSNNVPVDAALTVKMEQVLIVESTQPVPRKTEPSKALAGLLWMRGKLIENLGRLPAYLFERSQQIDRLSSRNLFVVSIAPSRDEQGWPPLFDFRRKTVKRMEQVAEADLLRRVGMVRSWGVPQFPLNVRVLGAKPARRASS